MSRSIIYGGDCESKISVRSAQYVGTLQLVFSVMGDSDSRVSDGELSHDISKVWLTLNCNEEMR